MDRRFFLKKSLGLTAALVLAPNACLWAAEGRRTRSRELSFYNLHTGEDLQVCYFSKGCYRSSALDDINYIMRDYRTDEIKPVDTDLLDLLHAVRLKLGIREPFQIISGYRSPSTNAMLRKKSKRVAKNSLHCQARAIDLNLDGVALNALRRAAMSLKGGGVGYYPKSGFVHLDTGPVRYW